MFNERQRKILSYIKQLERPCSIEELSTYFVISERTIRNDIKVIKSWCDEQKIQLHFKNSYLQLHKNERALLENRLQQTIDNDSITNSPLSRQLYITLTILMADESIQLHELVDQFRSSKSTISADMKAVYELLQKMNITLVSKKNGYSVETNELVRRMAMINVLEMLEFTYQSPTPFKYIAWANLSHKDVQQINELYTKNIVQMSNVDFPLYIALLVQLERIKNGSTFEVPNSPVFNVMDAPELNYESISTSFYNEFHKNVPVNEYKFIPLVEALYSHNIFKMSEAKTHTYISPTIQFLINQLGLGRLHNETIQLLNNEFIRIAMYLDCGMYRYNPLFHATYEKYKVIYQILENCKKYVEQLQHVPIHMWAEIVLLLAGELEIQECQSNKLRAILVCPNGSATSFFLEKRLHRHFPNITIVGAMSVEKYKMMKHTIDYDFVVSTVLLENLHEKVIVIPPFMDDKQFETLQTFIREIEQQKVKSEKTLTTIIPERYIEWKESSQTIEQLIVDGVTILQEQGLVDEQVQHELLATYEKFGMYFEIMPGLIMPHIISNHATQVGISCVCLNNPVSINGKKIYSSITLVSPNDEAHIHLLKMLYEILSNIKNVHEFCTLLEKRRATYES